MKQDRSELRAKAEAAEGGPWIAEPHKTAGGVLLDEVNHGWWDIQVEGHPAFRVPIATLEHYRDGHEGTRIQAEATAAYIAAISPSVLLPLLDALDAAEKRNREPRESLRECFCPRPANRRPDNETVGSCVDAGLCGCICGAPLRALLTNPPASPNPKPASNAGGGE